ncbi:MAG: LysR family transcriptional regulator [Pseudomonadota bacterium]|nr:LysR family transcriptional regulator [Pseudomonadota bacterium]
MKPQDDEPRLRLRLFFANGAMIGPGKADLLEVIRDTGSISAAGRAMSMSYKRAWSLVEEMNTAFRTPLVERARGGVKGGGAALSEAGETVLAHYRALERKAQEAGADEIAGIQALLSDMSDET